ncbi:MAG TPA: LysR family transcriptional regulator [Butyricicoccus pullicaecorum]|nr:LysR family transcriptional regulator [Butyricicoccus pullicaecorum]
MKLSRLKYFQVVCKHNNLTRAAEELHISQPALTHVIHELEQEFGLTLFLRQNKGLVLTEEGRKFLEEANLLLQQSDYFVSRMKFLGQSNQIIRMGLPPASATLFFPSIMHMLHRQSPQIKIDVVEIGSLTNQQKILDGELDAALISTNTPVSAAFGCYLLAQTRICLYVAADHPFAEREQISLREVCSIPLVMPTEESFLTTNTLKTCAQNKLTPDIMLHTNQIAIVSQLVQNGTAGTLLFHGTLPECTAYRAIPVQEFDDVYIYLIWNQYNPLSTALKQLIRAAKAVYPQPVIDFYCREPAEESPILNT